jgi:DNA-binding protein Fis
VKRKSKFLICGENGGFGTADKSFGAWAMRDQLELLVGQMVERGILFDEAVCELEKRFIKRMLERTHGNQSRAAKLLGIHRNTLSRKMGEYKLRERL